MTAKGHNATLITAPGMSVISHMQTLAVGGYTARPLRLSTNSAVHLGISRCNYLHCTMACRLAVVIKSPAHFSNNLGNNTTKE